MLVFVAKVMAQMDMWEQWALQGQSKHENQLAMSSRVLCGSAETREREKGRGKVEGSKRVDYDNDKQPIGLHSVTCSQLPDRPAAIAQHAM